MDWTTLAAAGMSLIGTLAGTFGGILVANKLTTYRSGKVVLDGKNAVDLKLVVRDYASKGAVTVKVYQQGRLINSTTVSASNGEFLIDLQGALRTAGQVVIE